MSKTKKPSPAQRRVLENLAAGLSADAHCNTRSDYGGLTGTLAVLRNAGWISAHRVITDAGRAAISQAPAKTNRPQQPAAVAWPAAMHDALRWSAAGLQAVALDSHSLCIDGERRTVGQVLDAANAALEAHALAAPTPVRKLPSPDLWRDASGLRGYTKDPGQGPWYSADTVRALLTAPALISPAGVGDMPALVRALAQALRKAAPNHVLPAKALDYLKRQGLQGSPLRGEQSTPVTFDFEARMQMAGMRGLLSEILAVGALSKHGDQDLQERVREAADSTSAAEPAAARPEPDTKGA